MDQRGGGAADARLADPPLTPVRGNATGVMGWAVRWRPRNVET